MSDERRKKITLEGGAIALIVTHLIPYSWENQSLNSDRVSHIMNRHYI